MIGCDCDAHNGERKLIGNINQRSPSWNRKNIYQVTIFNKTLPPMLIKEAKEIHLSVVRVDIEGNQVAELMVRVSETSNLGSI